MNRQGPDKEKADAGEHDELCYLSATEALARFRSRTLSPVELLEAQIARAEVVEPLINAFSAERFEAARKQARTAEQRYMKGDDTLAPLTGISVALKDEHKMQGENTTHGSRLYRDNIDDENHPLVSRLLRAGAIIHARSNVPEFSSAVFTRNGLHGTTRNPWNTTFSPGGSSGGAGAALAAGTTTLASGSDIAGSIRVPASLCGVVGLKPSYGRVPEGDPFYAQDTYNHNGPMARNVEDCALMLQVINGPDPRDPASLRPRLDVPATFADIRDMRIACSFDLGFFAVDDVVRDNTASLCRVLEDLGATVEEVTIPWDRSLADAARAHLGFLTGRDMARHLAAARAGMEDYSIEWAEIGLATTAEAYLASIRSGGEMYRGFALLMQDYDALICPTLATRGWAAEGKAEAFKLMMEECMTWPFNMLSRCPVLAVPSGIADNGIPTGVQIVGHSYDDICVLQIGANLQSALQWHKQHPPTLHE